MSKVFIRSHYNYDRDEVSRETGAVEEMEDMCIQSFAKECDINTIVKRFGLTGELPQGATAPTYKLFEDVFDFHSAMNAIAVARESFDAMPAEIRLKFLNDPQRFVEFCSDSKNLDEMRKMGLAIPAPKTDTTPTPPVVVEEKSDGVVKGGTGKADQAGS